MLQSIRRETTEMNPVPTSIPDHVLGEKVCDILLLTCIVKQEDLHTCCRMKYQKQVTLKFPDKGNINTT